MLLFVLPRGYWGHAKIYQEQYFPNELSTLLSQMYRSLLCVWFEMLVTLLFWITSSCNHVLKLLYNRFTRRFKASKTWIPNIFKSSKVDIKNYCLMDIKYNTNTFSHFQHTLKACIITESIKRFISDHWVWS